MPPRSKLLALYCGPGQASQGETAFLTLLHPRTGVPTQFIINNGHLLELSVFRKRHAAILSGDAVLSDGGLYMATPLDPLLFVLAHAAAQTDSSARTMFAEAEELLQSDACPALADLLPLVEAHLPCICDVKAAGDQRYFRFSQERARAWLQCKVAQTCAVLTAATPSPLPPGEAAAQVYAAGLLCEYLPQPWASEVMRSAQGAEEAQPNAAFVPSKRPGEPSDSVSKKPKVALDPKQKAAASRDATRLATLAKQAKGSLSLKSFFGKKS